jgi:SAM-dependent methyltransferase
VSEYNRDVKADMLAAIARKDREYHRRNAAAYDTAITDRYCIYHHWDLNPWIEGVAERHTRGRALDIGAGTGVVSVALAKRSFYVYALDHSSEMLAIARRKCGWAERRAYFVQGSVLRLPFTDAAFDVVTMQGILHHVPIAISEVIEEASRVLRPGGEFYISEPCATLSPVGRLLRFPLWFRPFDPEGEGTDEEPVIWEKLASALDRGGLKYKVRFLTHVPSARFHYWLPERLRLRITQILSWPFARGDLLFVHGSKVINRAR